MTDMSCNQSSERHERLRRLFKDIVEQATGAGARTLVILTVDSIDYVPAKTKHPTCPVCGIRSSLIDQISEDGW